MNSETESVQEILPIPYLILQCCQLVDDFFFPSTTHPYFENHQHSSFEGLRRRLAEQFVQKGE